MMMGVAVYEMATNFNDSCYTITRNKRNDSFEAVQYLQDVRHIADNHNRKNFPIYTRCWENHSNTCAENQKIRGLKFDTP